MHFNSKYARYDASGNIILLPAREEKIVEAPEQHQKVTEKDIEEGVVSSTWKVEGDKGQGTKDKRQEALSPKSIVHSPKLNSPRVNLIKDSARFAGTFTAVFLLLFVALNFGSFSQIFKARLMPDANSAERRALEVMTDPIMRQKLLSVPSLPRAGTKINIFSDVALDVAPPDNRVVIPSIGRNIPLVEVADSALIKGEFKRFEKDIQNALKFGVVRYPGTARPGQIGNVFITGHSSYNPWDAGRYKDVFALLGDLEVGDEYSIYYKGKLHKYRIAKKFEVSARDVSVLDQPTDRYMSTLMTCTPLGTNIRRLILQSDEVDMVTGDIIEVAGDLKNIGVADWGEELPI